jgi:MFS family permease
MVETTRLSQPADPTGTAGGSALILSTVTLTFLAYFSIGLPLAVLPVFIHNALGYAAVLAGLGISVQYVATVVSRAQVGRMSDQLGPKATALWGFSCIFLCGAFTLGAAWLSAWPAFSFISIVLGRLALGAGESMIGTGAITWAIGLVGPQQTVKVMSWNGVATYGGLAAGAPIGVMLVSGTGFAAIGVCTLGLSVAGLFLAWRKPRVALVKAADRAAQSVRGILAAVLPYGVALGLASTGFGVIAAFVTLFYADHHWAGAAFAVSTFGVAFIGARLILPRPIARFGGMPIALCALVIEAAGLILIWTAQAPLQALIGAALTGFGFAPIFPALGVEAMNRATAETRGVTLGLYSMFLDISLGVSGPLAGFLIGRYGYASPFALGAGATGAAFLVALRLYGRRSPI